MQTNWTTASIPRLAGRNYLVTGANSGLGLETSKALAAHGALVLMAGRNREKLAAAVQQVAATATGPQPTPIELDLADLASVRAAASQAGEVVDTLHVLINNAGVMAPPRGRTADGFETQIGTNHLGHFALTGLLMPLLSTKDPADDARVVNVSSMAHKWGEVDTDDLNFARRKYSPWAAYGQSKAANLLFTSEFARRATTAGLALKVAAAHPGFAATNLPVNGPISGRPKFIQSSVDRMTRLVGQSAAAGCLPQLYAATGPDVRSDDFFGPAKMGGWRGYPKRVSRSAQVCDTDLARRLWDESESVTGISFP